MTDDYIYLIHRICLSDCYSDSYHEIAHYWSIDEVINALEVINNHDAAISEEMHRREVESKMKSMIGR